MSGESCPNCKGVMKRIAAYGKAWWTCTQCDEEARYTDEEMEELTDRCCYCHEPIDLTLDDDVYVSREGDVGHSACREEDREANGPSDAQLEAHNDAGQAWFLDADRMQRSLKR